MKMFSDLILCKGFALCRGRLTANESFEYTSELSSTDGKFSQLLYLLEGGGSGPTGLGSVDNNKLLDFRDFYNKEYKLSADLRGATWLCINPIPANNFFDAELLVGEKEYIFEPEKNIEKIILCVENYITINEKIFNRFNYTRLLNKSAKVFLPVNSEAIFLSRVKTNDYE